MSHDIKSLLGPDDIRTVDRLLRAFVDEAGARCALLLDREGRSLTGVGDTAGLDETSFASLAAADFDASDELANLLGEKEFTSLYHQGVNGSMYLSDLGGTAILAAVFDQRTTLGLVRLKTREVLPRLMAELRRVSEMPRDGRRLDADFADDAATEIDRLFTG